MSGEPSVSDSERALLRKSVRDFLAKAWPAENAVENAENGAAVTKLWRAMAMQGLPSLGAKKNEGGLREILLVFEELGRASCPAPLLGAAAANLALAQASSNARRALLDDLHRGNAVVAAAFGPFDGDAAAGSIVLKDGTVTGKLSFVESAQAATQLVIFTNSPAGVAIVAGDTHGVTVHAAPGLAVPPFCELTFQNASALWLPVPLEQLSDVALAARLSCAARALGAAQRAFDLAVEHAKVRKQFGQFIGQFQAVQHKLANCLIGLDGARLALDAAAAARDSDNPAWRVFAASALAFAGPALRAAAVETHRALGAIGYAEEHEAPRHFRRVHADVVRFGGVHRARAELAEFLLGPVH
jgi:alkylation response protein AidB-like acyl-CoA dehydrogenase